MSDYIVNRVVIRPIIYRPAPAPVNGVVPINGDQLERELTAAGFTNVTVAVDGDLVAVQVDGLVDAMAPADKRAACADMDEVNALIAAQEATAAAANAGIAKALDALIAAHQPKAGS